MKNRIKCTVCIVTFDKWVTRGKPLVKNLKKVRPAPHLE